VDASAASPPDTAEGPKKKPRVLVVDDESAIRELISLYLSSMGFEVSTAGSTEEAKTVMERGQFGIVILDWLLGGVGGLHLLHLCKVMHPDIPVIIFSGAHLDESDLGGGSYGEADAVVRKGGPLEALSTAILRCLDRRQDQQSGTG
jgi:DNA-binding response OmpR family regulator